jgi:hypothetical protein
MIFKQYENGSCDIIFSKEEIEIINKKECIHLNSEALKHFGNHLMNIVVQWQIKFDDKLKNVMTFEDTEIVPDLKK